MASKNMDDGIRGVICNSVLEKLGSNGEVITTKKYLNSNVSIVRIGSQIGLSIQFRSVTMNFEIEKGSLKGEILYFEFTLAPLLI